MTKNEKTGWKSNNFLHSTKKSYYGFNREKILTNAWGKYHNKGGKKKLLSIIKII